MKIRQDQHKNERNIWECAGCNLPLALNDLGLCVECAAKLERDLIRARNWEYTVTAIFLSPDQQESLRTRIVREYGAKNELLIGGKPKHKNKRSHSTATKRKREIAANAIREYTTEDVLQAARSFLQAQNEEWVNVSRLGQHLYERFYKLKSKHLGGPGKKYKSILKFLSDMPDFIIRRDSEKSVYWIRLA